MLFLFWYQAFIFKASESDHPSPLFLIASSLSDLSLPYMTQQIHWSLLWSSPRESQKCFIMLPKENSTKACETIIKTKSF